MPESGIPFLMMSGRLLSDRSHRRNPQCWGRTRRRLHPRRGIRHIGIKLFFARVDFLGAGRATPAQQTDTGQMKFSSLSNGLLLRRRRRAGTDAG